ncbi:beta-N-acetylhexosaminidase [Hoyosella rhizosphaerae]|uniref:Glycoside hydrolase family 3 N-terminal domain-containing protein n=1 Tax=Hoyosella rhizosphaerae TaxID=1755582 RepID=A0A916TZA1_9ACTN|nr:glycoside hydrolase family 3 N-terminal domain-containing protein [Hoyosella rhizosphaerae]MBN4927126.1 beta-N-acetylhexosaminidase [Hoyosella rhizosphaerae]GGC53766.1 hypothetical protein GCM10011410_02700 [Hoyosella rhizosphaerae]
MDRRGFLRTAAIVGAAGALPMHAAAAHASPFGSLAGPLSDLLSGPPVGARRVIYSYRGATPPPELFDRVRRGIGGIIFFSENITSTGHIAEVTRQLTATALSSGYSLRLFVDQEGGPVKRLPGGPTLSAKQVGTQPNVIAAAQQQGREASATIQAAGMNANLAPVLGVYRRPGDFLDATQRSFSTNTRIVGDAAAEFIRTSQSMGVSTCAKHFPGLGAAPTAANTDVTPVTITLDEHTLRTVDEMPYQAAIAAGVHMVMPSWAVYPALDGSRPAGMSAAVLQGRLRQRLGFRGLIVSDAIEAGALATYGSTGNRVRAAVAAGNDLVCCAARDVAQGDEAAAALAGI